MFVKYGIGLFRDFFSIIDGGLYHLIGILYDILIQLSKTSIFTSADIDAFSKRVYVFLGIIMLFKVTFSLINYLINPDAIADKTNGAGNLSKNIIITLVLVVFVPYAFDLLYRAQSAILNDNIIPKLIIGTGGESGTHALIIDDKLCVDEETNEAVVSNVPKVGDYIAIMAFKPFYQASKDVSDEFADTDYYCASHTVKDMLKYHDEEVGSEYIFDYTMLLSTASGVLVLLLLLGFCFDIAVRTIKLGFLEIIAPIPIISYVDPKSGKNGMFSKWVKEVINTWASLFIRLALLFFVVYIIETIGNNLGTLYDNGIWIMLFLIIGALMFAKQAPALIENILGVKATGTMKLNPLKKIQEQAIGGKMIASLPGRMASGVAGAAFATTGLAIANTKKSSDFYQKQNEYEKAFQNHYNAQNNLNNLKTIQTTNEAELQANKTKLQTNKGKYEAAYNDVQNKIANGTVTNSDFENLQKLNQQYQSSQVDVNKSENKVNEAKEQIKEAEIEVSTAQQKVNKTSEAFENQKEQNDKSFSYNHPLAAGLAAAYRASTTAGKNDPKNIREIISNASKAATSAAKTRTYTDNYNIEDRMKNVFTDWADIKKGGTASIVDSNIKEINDNIIKVTNALDSLRQERSAFEPGTFKTNTKTFEVEVSQLGINNQAAIDNVQQTKELEQVLKDLNSELKKQTSIKEQTKINKKS